MAGYEAESVGSANPAATNSRFFSPKPPSPAACSNSSKGTTDVSLSALANSASASGTSAVLDRIGRIRREYGSDGQDEIVRRRLEKLIDWWNAVNQTLRTVFSARMLVALLMGFSSGLPLLLTGSVLQAWLTDEGVDLGTIGLFALVGACWLPVVWIQIRLRDMLRAGADLDSCRPLMRVWIALGVPAFLSVIVIFGLMVYKPWIAVTV